MRIFIQPTNDQFEAKRRAKHYLQCLSEYGAKPKVRNGKYVDGADHFDIELPQGMNPADMSEMLAALSARGVTIHAEDIKSLVSDPIAREAVTAMVQKKLVDADIPVEDVGRNLSDWVGSVWIEPSELTEQQEQAAYEAIVNKLPADDGGISSNSAQNSRSDLRGLLDEADEWLEKHKSENPGTSYEVSRWSAR